MGGDCFIVKGLPEVSAPGAHLCELDCFRNLTETNAEAAGARLDFRRQLGETSRAWRSPGPTGGHSTATPEPTQAEEHPRPARPPPASARGDSGPDAPRPATSPARRSARSGVPIQSLKRFNYFFFTGTLATHKPRRGGRSQDFCLFSYRHVLLLSYKNGDFRRLQVPQSNLQPPTVATF